MFYTQCQVPLHKWKVQWASIKGISAKVLQKSFFWVCSWTSNINIAREFMAHLDLHNQNPHTNKIPKWFNGFNLRHCCRGTGSTISVWGLQRPPLDVLFHSETVNRVGQFSLKLWKKNSYKSPVSLDLTDKSPLPTGPAGHWWKATGNAYSGVTLPPWGVCAGRYLEGLAPAPVFILPIPIPLTLLGGVLYLAI